MCGIAGIVSQRDGDHLVASVHRMVASLLHRGPDSSGIHDFGRCVLGNTRLAINDLSERGSQPMCNEDSTIWIVYNGESYNAADLRSMLLNHGHRFRSTSDTEVVLHLYEQFGEDCVSMLRGMFAFAIWDTRTSKLLLARDRLGIKPLYYALTGSQLLFASEIKAILASTLIERRVEPVAVRTFLQLGHIPPPRTAIHNLKVLEPGHVAIWFDGDLQVRPYWTLPVSADQAECLGPAEAASSLHDILLEATRSQLMSDVPMALFLSGGVDSAVLGSLLRSVGASQLTALTIGFEEKQYDESESSCKTAEMLGLPHRIVHLSASRMSDWLDHALWAMDQPTVDGMNSYWISRVAAEEGFKVALTGQGGDELFGGYRSIAWFNRFCRVAQLLKLLPASAGQAIFDHTFLPFRLRKLSYLMGADDPFVAAQLAVRLLFLERDVSALLHPDLAPHPDSESEVTAFIRELALRCAEKDLTERIAFVDFPAHLESRLLRDGDAFSMANSLELRPIFLDHAVVEFVLSLPASLRLRDKRLLLDAVRTSMPTNLYAKLTKSEKQTFTFPFARWLGADLRTSISTSLSPERIAATGILNASAVTKLWNSYLNNPKGVGWSRLWSVFVLARWCEIMQVGA